ncbi:MAG: alkaline phosphatase, partial [Bacteroidales bacterium]
RITLVGLCFATVAVSCKPEVEEEKEYDQPVVESIIFLIGDGMGVSQIYAGLTANRGKLNLEKCEFTGFVKTHSSNSYITDSAAGGTAFACGKKTKNGMISMDPDSTALRTILEIAEDEGLATGLVSTSSITHATPASFIAHQINRNRYEEIAADFLKTDIDVFIGGGRNHFDDRTDGRILTEELKNKGYTIAYSMDEIAEVNSRKLAGFTAEMHNPRISHGRGSMLEEALQAAIKILNKNEKGFFLMAEGSMIDWGSHQNNTEYVTDEMVDFDRAIGKAIDFAENDGHTLVVITADHETGGMAILDGDMDEGTVEAAYTTKGHTGTMVPVFAFGPGAGEFSGIYDNTEIFFKFMDLLNLEND